LRSDTVIFGAELDVTEKQASDIARQQQELDTLRANVQLEADAAKQLQAQLTEQRLELEQQKSSLRDLQAKLKVTENDLSKAQEAFQDKMKQEAATITKSRDEAQAEKREVCTFIYVFSSFDL
jgi:chromosome segregation ATPase